MAVLDSYIGMSFRYWLGDMIIFDITSAGFGLSKVTLSLTCLVPMTEDLKWPSLILGSPWLS